MTTLTISTDETLQRELERIAQQRDVTMAEIVSEALSAYVNAATKPKRAGYSFIGIGRSGNGKASVEAEEVLAREADRRTGWSFPA